MSFKLPWPDEYAHWAGQLACLSGSFQDNVQALIDILGQPVALPGNSLQAWGIAIAHPDGKQNTPRALKAIAANRDAPAVCWLHVYRELVVDEADAACDQCRIMGWNVHPMCGEMWHFIIPAPEDVTPQHTADGLHEDAAGAVVQYVDNMLHGRAKAMPPLAVQDVAVGCLESSRHLLHGILHGNGYGHLLRLNGKTQEPTTSSSTAAPSVQGRPILRTPHGPVMNNRRRLRSMPSLTMSSLHTAGTSGTDTTAATPMARPRGRQMMDLWDALCTLLRVYEVSIEDVSNKIGMELRVLLPIAYGHTFYGDWEYKFGRAGYGGHVEDWEAAVQALARMPLDTLTQIHRHNFAVCSIIDRYQAAASRGSITAHTCTLHDLIAVMLKLCHDVPAACAVLSGSTDTQGTALHASTVDSKCAASAVALMQAVVKRFNAAPSSVSNKVQCECPVRLLTAQTKHPHPAAAAAERILSQAKSTHSTRPAAKRAAAVGANPARSSKRNKHGEAPTDSLQHKSTINGIDAARNAKDQAVQGTITLSTKQAAKTKRGLVGAAAAAHARKMLWQHEQQQEECNKFSKKTATQRVASHGKNGMRLTGAAPASHARKHQKAAVAANNDKTKLKKTTSPPVSRELRTLLQDLDSMPETIRGPRKSNRPTFYNPSLQQPVVVLATRQRAGRLRGHGGPGSPAHTSLGHLGLVASPGGAASPTSPPTAAPRTGLPGADAPWDPANPSSACLHVKADLQRLFEHVLRPAVTNNGNAHRNGNAPTMAAFQQSLQVLYDTKHFVKDYCGIALPSGVSPPPSMWRLLLSLRLTNALPPFLQHDKVSADDDSHESSSDKEGDAKCKTEPVPATKQVPMVKQRKYRKRSKWTRLKGAHRKPAPEATTALLSNNAASAHGVGKRGAFGFPQRLLDAAEHNAAVAKGLRLRLHSEVPPFVLVVPAATTLRQVVSKAQDVLAAMYPLFQHAALKVHLADQARVGRARGPRSDPVGMPREVIQGSALLLEGSLSGQWSPKWRFSGGGVEWVVRCTCGLFDDDGNHMVLCDACGFWMHSRCEGLAEDAPPPPFFVCSKCKKG